MKHRTFTFHFRSGTMFHVTKLNRIVWIAWMISGLYGHAFAQVPGMRKYTQFDGFTASIGYIMEQDHRGCLWIGTDNGGMSFDGKRFRVLQQIRHSSDADILSCNPVSDDRIILVPITNSIRMLDKGRLITTAEDPKLGDTASRTYNLCLLDPVTGAKWVSNSHSLKVLQRFKDNNLDVFRIKDEGFLFKHIQNNRFIGVSKDNYLSWYNFNTNTYHYFYGADGKKITALLGENQIIAGGNHSTFISYYRSAKKQINIYRYVENDSILNLVRTIQLPRDTSEVYYTLVDDNQNLWVKFTGKGGVSYYGKANDGSDRPYFRFMQNCAVNSIFVDRNSNIWMTSQNNALYFLSRQHFENALLADRFPLKQETPKMVSGDARGRLLISYTNSSLLSWVDGNKSHIIKLKSGRNEGARRIMPLGDDRYFIADVELAIFNAKDHSMQFIGQFANYKDVCRYGDDGILVASTRRLQYVSLRTRKVMLPESIFEGRPTAIEAMKDGRILVGTANGLYVKENLQGKAVRTRHAALSDSYITDFQLLPDGGSLIGTNGRGLYHYAANGTITEVKTPGGKPERVNYLYLQNDSCCWIASDEGAWSLLFNRDWTVKRVRNYTFYDGLPSNNVNSVFVSRDTAFIATVDGIGVMPIKDSQGLSMAAPEIYLNNLQAGTRVFRYPAGTVSLDHKQNNLLFSLSILSYESLGNTHYYYRLYPFQKQWVRGTDPDIRFPQLPPGDYIFQTYAYNAEGIKSRKIASLRIKIAPTFLQTVYFKVLLLLIGATLFYFLLRWWLLRQEKKKYIKIQDKKRLAELELEAIKAQINPHFIYNCLNSIQYLNYKAKHEQAQEYLDLFARLIRMTMQYSQQAFIPLDEEINYLSLYLQLEKLRFKDKLHYTIETDPALSPERLLPAMLIQPYVENAVKHGVGSREKGEIRIMFRTQGDRLLVTVQDDGPGFSNQRRPGALGLKLSGTRALSYNELFNLNIDIHSYNSQDHKPNTTGAVVNISIPAIHYGTTN